MTEIRRVDLVALALLTLAAAVSAAVAGCAPTGVGGWDAVVSAGFAASVVLAATVAPRWTLLPLLVPAVALGGSLLATVAGLQAMALPAIASPASRLQPVLRAAAAATATAILLRLPPVGPFGLPSLVVAVAVLPLAVASLRRLRVPPAMRRPALAVLAGAALWAGAAGMQVVSARSHALEGAAAARAGLQAARDGDPEASVRQLTRAAGELREVDERIGAWWLGPLRIAPVSAQNVSAVAGLADHGARVADHAARAAQQADLERLRGPDGAIDLPLVTGMRPSLVALVRVVEDARRVVDETGSPWLVPPAARNADALDEDLEEAAEVAEVAVLAAEGVPSLLGGDGERRYLVLFANPAETRELGGMLAAYVELVAIDGRLQIGERGNATQLGGLPVDALQDRASYPARFLQHRPHQYAANWTGMPDLPSVARAVADLYPAAGGAPIDGVIYVDPVAVEALLALTGPIAIDGVPYEITTANVRDFLMVDQYRIFELDPTRKDLLADVAASAFELVTEQGSLGPAELSSVLRAPVRDGHLQVEVSDARLHPLLDRLGLRSPLPAPDGSDYLHVVQSNGAPNKLDAYLHRDVEYRVDLDPRTGDLTAVVDVVLRNDPPADLPAYALGRPIDGPPGTNRVFLSIYTPHWLEGLTVDGERSVAERQQEFGHQRYIAQVPVLPGGRSTVQFRLRGAVSLDDRGYVLRLQQQPLVNPDAVQVVLDVGELGAAAGSDATRIDLTDVTNRSVEVVVPIRR